MSDVEILRGRPPGGRFRQGVPGSKGQGPRRGKAPRWIRDNVLSHLMTGSPKEIRFNPDDHVFSPRYAVLVVNLENPHRLVSIAGGRKGELCLPGRLEGVKPSVCGFRQCVGGKRLQLVFGIKSQMFGDAS